MRKHVILLVLATVMLFTFTACGGNKTVYLDNLEYEPNITVIEADEENENVPMPTNPHQFATALSEYIADYDGVVRAYLATLDDDGTMGVLTTRPNTRLLVDYDLGEYRYGPSGTLFFMQDGDLLQIDISGWFFVAGRYNRLMERIYAHTHLVEIIYKLESGRLEISTQLEYFSDEYLAYLFDDDYDAVTESIARRDARAEYAREKYGLVALPPPNFGHMRNMEDQTAQILAMTIDCVPSLAASSAQQGQAATWQEAYTETLRFYATGQHLNEWETGWEFTLHDINQDGIPELFLGARQISGHIDYRYVYTFLGGEEISGGAVRLDFQGFLTDGAIFSPIDNSPWVVAFLAVGSGGRYVKLEMIELGLVTTVEGMASMSEEGHEMMFAYDNFDWQNYEWYNLTIGVIEVTVEEFESVFGAREDRVWLDFHEVNHGNIAQIRSY